MLGWRLRVRFYNASLRARLKPNTEARPGDMRVLPWAASPVCGRILTRSTNARLDMMTFFGTPVVPDVKKIRAP